MSDSEPEIEEEDDEELEDDEWEYEDEDEDGDEDGEEDEQEEGDDDDEELDASPESIYEGDEDEDNDEDDGEEKGDDESEDEDSALAEPTDQEKFAAELQAQLDPLDPMRRVEAVLFLAKEPLHSRKLSQLAGLEDGTQARSFVKKLNQHYDDMGRAFNVKQVAGGFQIRTRPMFSPWLKKVQGKPVNSRSLRLSGPAMETLSVVAYRQPVLKADVEAIRGVSCGELLRQLLDRGLVRIAGRSPELGNPFMYGTTRRFLEVFGLSSVEALPRGDRLRGKGLPDWNLSPDSEEVSEETTGNMSSEYLGDQSIPDAGADSSVSEAVEEGLGAEPENLAETSQNPLDES